MIIYTDASFTTKPKMSGLGCIIITKDGDEYSFGSHREDCINNNVAEICAISSAINFIKKNGLLDENPNEHITILTDSQYSLGRILHSHESRNIIERQELTNIKEFISSHKVDFFWVKGHTHNGTKMSYYNNMADNIAKEHRVMGLEKYHKERKRLKKLGLDISSQKNYDRYNDSLEEQYNHHKQKFKKKQHSEYYSEDKEYREIQRKRMKKEKRRNKNIDFSLLAKYYDYSQK